MIYIIPTLYKSCTLKIPISAKQMSNVFVIVTDYDVPQTILTRRFDLYAPGDNTPLYIQMPLTGKNIVVEIFDDDKNRSAAPVGFVIGQLELLGLPTKMDVARNNDPYFDEWLMFRGQFAFNAKWLPVNLPDKVYRSANNNFQIKYVDMIVDEKGVEDVTPMNRNKLTGIINVSRKKIVGMDMTVPGISCVLDHEYAHMNRNKNRADELEADLNGLTISLGTGAPRYECKEAFYQVIYNVDTEENAERLFYVDDFVDKFDLLTA